MLLRTVFTWILFFIGLLLHAQYRISTDTSSFDHKSYSQANKIKQHIDYVFQHFRGHAEQANIATLTYLLHRAQLIQQQDLTASSHNVMGAVYALTGKYDKALQQYQLAIVLFEATGNTTAITTMYNNIGMVYNNSKQYPLAIDYFKKGLALSETYNNDRTACLIHINLANLYIQLGDLNNSLLYALKADSLTQQLNMKVEQAVNLNLIGAIYFYKNDFAKAVQFYTASKNVAASVNDFHSVNTALLNIGEVQVRQKDTAAANSLQTAYQYFTSVSDNYNIQLAAQLLKEYYMLQNNYAQALQYAEKAFAAEKKMIDSTNYKTFSTLQTTYETAQKENKIRLLSQADSLKSLRIVQQQLALSNSLYLLTQQRFALTTAQLKTAEDSLLIAFKNKALLQSQLEAAKQADKINVLSKEALQQQVMLQQKQIAINQKNTTIAIVAGLCVIVLLLGYGMFRKKQLAQEALLLQQQAMQREVLTKAVIDAEEAERKRIAADLHDGVGQLFSAVKMNLQGLLDRIDIPKQEDVFLAEKTMALVDESCKEVRVISHNMMPNFLLKSGIASDIRNFIEKIDENTLKIHFESKGFRDQLEHNEEVILYRVVQELVNNVMKHAAANELQIILEKKADRIQIQVTDNGKGFDYSSALAKGGLGLKNMLVRVEYLKGNIQFLPNKPSGTAVYISIPIA